MNFLPPFSLRLGSELSLYRISLPMHRISATLVSSSYVKVLPSFHPPKSPPPAK